MRIKIFIIASFFTYTFSGCSSTSKNTSYSIAYNHTTECITTNMDGSEIVKSWANGESSSVGIAAAKKNALHDVLFKGIIRGKSNCEQMPIINEVNAEEKYEKYFNKFFSENGGYKKFVEIKDDITKLNANSTGVILIIKRFELVKKLKMDKVLNN